MKRNAQCHFSIDEEKQIIQEYLNGAGGTTIAKKWNCGYGIIYNILKAYNIPRRTLSEARRNVLNYTLDENIFENIEGREKAYWLGVMYTDGYISSRKYTNAFGIAVKESDKEWLEKFKKFLGYNGEIHHYQNSETSEYGATKYVRLIIGNNKIVEDLKKFGVIEHKTKFINSLPNISDKFLDDFIRGVIDGDGSLRAVYPGLRICGNYDFLINIANYLKLPFHIYQDKSIYDLTYNTKESEYLEKRLYNNAPVYLQRKYEIASRSFNSPLTLEDVLNKAEYQGKS